MRQETIHIPSLEALPEAARKFMSMMGDYTVFTFNGDMGAGKTTFISALSAALGVDPEEANSPSFAIVNEYRSDTTAELIYHFDLYRLESLEEAMDIGFEDYLDSGALCLVEWPGVVADILPDDTVAVDVRLNDDNSRTLTVTLPE
ncbi:MAG: tRNA (adenosine(37)-N6)-threonylcarbamoyltransferase complex ATPase subunit type 1 TsaE [Muribaculaceae bacterium]|nr:tRNA (adenosine(37)-N6)-threonylcarbamoyltransferase complex ATPase subunit type 1 TsaE [Muribaculaceae bacterium]